MANINRDYLVVLDVKTGNATAPNMYFYNTDKSTSNIYVQLVVKETVVKATPIENATDFVIVAKIIKPGKVLKEMTGVLVNIEEAIYEFDLPTDFTNLSGNYDVEFWVSAKVSDSNETITSSNIMYKVKQSILTELDPSIDDTNDYPLLIALKEELESLKNSGQISHTHENKSVLDGITSAKVTNWDTAYTHSQSTHFNGNYNNLTDKPIIPTNTSQLINDSGFITEGSIDFNFIDDTTINTNKTWSSSKIDSQIKELAIKIDNIGESGGSSGGSSGDTTTSDYDTEISLPFTASGGNADVKLVFSKGNEISNPSYTNEVTGNTPNDFEVLKYGSPTGYTLENTTVDGINCLKFQYTGGVHYYRLYSNKNTEKIYGSDKWFVYMKVKLGGDADSNNLPSVLAYVSSNLTSISGFNGETLTNQFNSSSTDWQELSVAGQVNQIEAYMNKNPQIGFLQATGTIYIAKAVLVNLTENGLESKTKSELFAMVKNGEFDNNSSSATTTEFSCTVTNGSTTEDITPFTDTGVTKYYTVSNGSTLSIAQRAGYGMPSIQALIKSKSTSTVEIEDCDLKLNTRFRGKKVIFEGDSITDYDYSEEYNNKSWANYLTSILGMNLVSNGAVGGSLLTHSNEATGFSVQQRIINTTYDNNAKLFLIHAGTNDWGQAKTLGNIDSTDISTICGALNNIIDKIQTNCPKATIVIISPIHRQSDSGGFSNNSAGYSLYDIAVAYQKVCSRWGAKFINGLELGLNSLNTNNLATNFIDGLHPTPAGHKIMAVEIARKIATF